MVSAGCTHAWPDDRTKRQSDAAQMQIIVEQDAEAQQ
jgi:hypothetical protein